MSPALAPVGLTATPFGPLKPVMVVKTVLVGLITDTDSLAKLPT